VALLEVDQVDASYGNVRALHGVSLAVDEGEIVCLIGANGAGKSTTLKVISGLLRPRSGQVRLDGQRIDRLPGHRIVRLGICQAPEGRRIFPRMTVLENLEMGAFARRDGVQERDLAMIYALFPRLKERTGQLGGTLSGGEQQMLAIGRALMARPRILLLDEPSMGLAPNLVELIFDTIREINQRGTSILLVEQNAVMALEVASRGYVLETGSIVLHDTTERLRADPTVQRAYLGLE
jgi:branched-chain amino acid transport system ATP-binding protein